MDCLQSVNSQDAILIDIFVDAPEKIKRKRLKQFSVKYQKNINSFLSEFQTVTVQGQI